MKFHEILHIYSPYWYRNWHNDISRMPNSIPDTRFCVCAVFHLMDRMGITTNIYISFSNLLFLCIFKKADIISLIYLGGLIVFHGILKFIKPHAQGVKIYGHRISFSRLLLKNVLKFLWSCSVLLLEQEPPRLSQILLEQKLCGNTVNVQNVASSLQSHSSFLCIVLQANLPQARSGYSVKQVQSVDNFDFMIFSVLPSEA